MNKYLLLKKYCGAGLIEVLVSLLILAVGLLGVLSLQANGLNSNQRAEFIGQAQILAQDMADRIMAFGATGAYDNRGALADGVRGAYGNIDTDTFVGGDPGCTAPSGSGCSADNTVLYDAWEWSQLFDEAGLPDGRGEVSFDGSEDEGVFTITIYWNQDRVEAPGDDCDSLACYIMEVSLRSIPE